MSTPRLKPPERSGAELMRSIVGKFGKAFYKGNQKGFYQDLGMLRRATSWPATWIKEHGTGEYLVDEYEAVFNEIIEKVLKWGVPPEKMHCIGAYLLKAVQDHWRHNWERLAPLSKGAAISVEMAMRDIQARARFNGDRPMAVLAQAHGLLTTGRPKGSTKRKPREIQGELF